MIPATINNLPVFWAQLADPDDGVYRVSLVDYPAVERDFEAFNASKRMRIYAIADEEKRIVRGVLMRADYPIYRQDSELGEWYIVFNAQTIREMTERMLQAGLHNAVNLMHAPGSDVEGVDLVQLFIKDTGAGVAPAGFDDISDGSLFGEYHVVNDDVWAAIKAGTYRGFSIEGYFSLTTTPQELLPKNNKMSILDKFKARLARVLAELGAVSTDRGALMWDGDEDLKAGLEVYVEGDDGRRKPAPDGDYKTEDGKVIKIARGKVSEIVDDKAEVDGADESGAGGTQAGKDVEDLRREIQDLRREIEEHDELLELIVKALEANNVAIKAWKQQSAARSASETFRSGAPVGKTGNRRLDRIAEILGK